MFNASSYPKGGGKSLNDCLYSSPSLTTKLHNLLLTFCFNSFAVISDISKAFHLVILHPEHCKWTKFLWVNPEHQASLTASHTAFLTLKLCQFYLSHLPAYFSDVNKRAMLSSPAACADFLFSEADVARLLADTQTSSSLRSQQALADIARGSGACSKRFSPLHSPSRPSPSWRRRCDSGSPARSGKRVRFDSPAPSSALKDSR